MALHKKKKTIGPRIGTFLMAGSALARWEGILGGAGSHAAGGMMGRITGAALVNTLFFCVVIVVKGRS